MPVDYVDFEEARQASGLRMIVVSAVPSPWGEAAKGILHVKGIPWKAVRLDQASDAMAEWSGERSGPVAFLDDEAPRSGWLEILLLAERLAPAPSLVPTDPVARAEMLGLCQELCGEQGLGWVRRLQGIHEGMTGGGGFPAPVAKYLAGKYGYRADEASSYSARAAELLELFARRLKAERDAGRRYYLGDRLTALDVYSATFMALVQPLPPEDCPMPDAMRTAFGTLDDATEKALDPILLEHRDFVYAEHLERPLSL
ncbi:MAG: hypothetical protein NXI30_06000 [bacterium]|nr:hypothetical protein [bacterium]